MWREEVGITEMMLAYIGEFAEFRGWSSWRTVVIDILTCHEEARRRRSRFRNSEDYFTCKVEVKQDLPAYLSEAESDRCLSIMDSAENMKSSGSDRMIDLTCEEATDSLLVTDVKVEQCSEEYPIAENSVDGKELDSTFDCDDELIARHLDGNEILRMNKISINQLGISKHSDVCDNLTSKEDLHKEDVWETVEHSHQPISQPMQFSTKIFSAFSTPAESADGTADDFMDAPVDRTCSSSDGFKGQSQSSLSNVYRLHKCRFCNERFTNSSQLKHHLRSHSNENSKQCSFCSKMFFSPSHRRSHERIHTGEKPFACSYCPKRFNQNSIRKTHEITHTGERPYACSYCGQRFKCRSSRLKHQRTHHTDAHYSIKSH